ncbi:ATP-binding protein [Listeria monocytogenes]|uniref:ATP-binding protein n=1 Tax=Listeria monocytogenes TaxID=1639 RepID=UPI0010B956B3|nr:ATP-binding protein [Listeria monocytogenes]EAC8502972.1 ATP-binding protein [Listeria monocytogenes]EAD2137252.1 ATP-binding protein [Listeria monocytogenes]EAD2761836.1 ATP-binding protein [Listeria monocytogenes]EAD8642364.1 ATP-binding protein [Listeria monocytogenes]EJH5061281.1 ATP-binding protein [Listeria monocytogenes]
MKNLGKKLGVIVGVDADISQVGMYSMSNDSNFIWYGEILTGPKIGAFLTINQNDVKIIATVASEKIIDQQNTVKSVEFDNRYHKDSINRIITLKTKGVIEDNKFQVTSKYVPMVGNEITITSKEELDIIFELDVDEESIYIGKSLLEDRRINLSINKFFASHIGVFGNTGSGKSNTLHRLYLQLFRSNYFSMIANGVSQFFVIDFNGEYTSTNSFGVQGDDKEILEIKTGRSQGNKLPIKKEYLFNADILAILFDARVATQVPFLRKAIQSWNEKNFDGNGIAQYVVGTIKAILSTGESASSEAKDNWISVAKKYVEKESLFGNLSSLNYNSQNKSYNYLNGDKQYINDKEPIKQNAIDFLQLEEISNELAVYFNSADEISKLKMHLEFQKVHQSSWKSTNIEHLNPLFNRIDSAFTSLSKVIEIVPDISDSFKTMNVISLVHANQEITRLIPMLLSKMIYDEQKDKVAGNIVTCTKHLIIDEAHNILNAEYRNHGDDWQDYRMSVFEEIVKEGRKFGFYLTLSSQRPADISPTILSQIHNYLIHRLVNEKDLRMLENTMPTLDKSSYQMIPSLGQGEAIITGNAMQIPVFVKVIKEKHNRPNSDDVPLTEIWNKYHIK